MSEKGAIYGYRDGCPWANRLILNVGEEAEGFDQLVDPRNANQSCGLVLLRRTGPLLFRP
jgi:hypothetical protein